MPAVVGSDEMRLTTAVRLKQTVNLQPENQSNELKDTEVNHCKRPIPHYIQSFDSLLLKYID